MKYHKINSIYKRDEKGRFIEGQWSCPEFEYLQNNEWAWTEKVDGTNIRVYWDGEKVRFGGRTDNAQIPVFLYDRLNELFPAEKFAVLELPPLTLYGEGYGARIQKGGGNYLSDRVDFVLFDVRIDDWWLKRQDVCDIRDKLKIKAVPVVGIGTIQEAIDWLPSFTSSTWGDFKPEGIVLRPATELQNRAGQRIVTKLKHRDLERMTDE